MNALKSVILILVTMFFLSVSHVQAQSVTVSSNPATSAAYGSSVTFTAVATPGPGADAVAAYNWSVDGSLVSGSGNTYTTNALSVADHNVRCDVTFIKYVPTSYPQAYGQVTISILVPPVVTLGVSSNPACSGASVTFSAGFSSSAYSIAACRWYKNGVDLNVNPPLATYTTSVLANGDQIYCKVTFITNGIPYKYVDGISNTATMSIQNSFTVGITGNSAVCDNTGSLFGPYSYTAVPSAGTPTYTWSYTNTSNSSATYTASGSPSPYNFSLTSGTTGSGTINVSAVSGVCTATATLPVSITKATTDAVANITGPASGCHSAAASYTAINSTNVYSYNWSATNGVLATATATTPTLSTTFYNVSPTAPKTTGVLTSVVKYNSCLVRTSTLNLTVARNLTAAEKTAFVISPGNTDFCYNSTKTYTLPVTYTNLDTYTWTAPSWASIGGQGSSSVTLTYTSGSGNGNLGVSGYNNICSTTEVTATPKPLTFWGPIGTLGAITGNGTVCMGPTSINYSVPTLQYANTYTWSFSPANIAAGSSTTNSISYVFNNTAGYGTISVNASNSICSTAVAVPATLPVNALPTGSWSGITDTDWSKATNWCGGVPTASTDIKIDLSHVANIPTINNGVTGQVRWLQISNGTADKVNVLSGGVLQIYGNTNNGSLGIIANSGSRVEFNGTSAQTFSSPAIFADLKINNATGITFTPIAGPTYPSILTVTGILNLTSGLIKSTDPIGELYFKSGSSVIGGSNTSYAEAICKKFGPGDFKFPVGKGGVYAPVEYTTGTNTSYTAGQSMSVQFFNSTPTPVPGTPYPLGVASYYTGGFWKTLSSKPAFVATDGLKFNFYYTNLNFVGVPDNAKTITKSDAAYKYQNVKSAQGTGYITTTPLVYGTINSSDLNNYFALAAQNYITLNSSLTNAKPYDLYASNGTTILKDITTNANLTGMTSGIGSPTNINSFAFPSNPATGMTDYFLIKTDPTNSGLQMRVNYDATLVLTSVDAFINSIWKPVNSSYYKITNNGHNIAFNNGAVVSTLSTDITTNLSGNYLPTGSSNFIVTVDQLSTYTSVALTVTNNIGATVASGAPVGNTITTNVSSQSGLLKFNLTLSKTGSPTTTYTYSGQFTK